jgi:hypothetical protein
MTSNPSLTLNTEAQMRRPRWIGLHQDIDLVDCAGCKKTFFRLRARGGVRLDNREFDGQDQ